MHKKIMTDTLYLNSLYLMASTFIMAGFGFIFWIIVAHYYSTDSVGIATTVLSVMTLLASLSTVGLNVSLSRFLPKSKTRNALITTAFSVVALTSIITTSIFLAGLTVFSPDLLFLRSNIFYIISFIIFVICYTWELLVDSVFVAYRAASNVFWKSALLSVLKLIFPFFLLMLGAYGIITANAIAMASAVIFSYVVLKKRFSYVVKPVITFSLLKEMASFSWGSFVAGLLANAPSLLLPVIIINTLSPKYAAYYYIASMIQNILYIIPLATTQTLLTEGAYDEKDLQVNVRKAVISTFLLLIPATLIIVFFGGILLHIFGKSYAADAFQFLQLYSISTVFTAVILIGGAIFRIKHHLEALIFMNLIGAILTIGYSYAFISYKLVGIGLGWIIGQGITAVLFTILIAIELNMTRKKKLNSESHSLKPT